MNTLEVKVKNVYQILLNDYTKGIIHCGTNGPYDDPETKVRNLCNLIIASCAYLLTESGEEVTTEIINRMATDLLGMEDADGLFIIRSKGDKDSCNGVLGHAWVIEALLYLYEVSKNQIYLEKSQKIYSAHEFDKYFGLWKCPKKFGNRIDMTINHQIWFAGVAAELYFLTKNSDIRGDLLVFERKFWENTRVHVTGLFCHYVQSWNGVVKIRNDIRNLVDKIYTLIGHPSMYYKENGYHMFCLCGLARLKTSGVGDVIFNNRHFKKSLDYCNTHEYLCGLESKEHHKDGSKLVSRERGKGVKCNLYGYPYNAPGLEAEYVKNVFGIITDKTVEQLEEQQLLFTFNEQTGLFDQNAVDVYDLNYKIYEKLVICDA